MLPYYKPKKQVETDDSCSDSSGSSAHDEAEGISESDKLKKAFGQVRYILYYEIKMTESLIACA